MMTRINATRITNRRFDIPLLLVVAPLAVALVAAEAGAVDDPVTAGILACRDVPDAAERLACFDALAGRIGEQKPAALASAGDEAGARALPPLGEEVGKARTDDAPAEEYSGRVTSCEKSELSGRWVFTFDNGQVWRQSNTGRLPFRECDFAVTLRRDMFGYKLEIPSANRSVRVSRIH